MALRDDVYRQFGPVLMEALFDMILDEVNQLRTNAGLPERTKEYFLGRAHNAHAHLPPYDWMSEQENYPP